MDKIEDMKIDSTMFEFAQKESHLHDQKFDTKPVGYRVDDTTIKANALANYLVRINTDRGSAPKVVGGIVVKDGTQFYYYPNENYHDYAASHDGWLNFNELFSDL